MIQKTIQRWGKITIACLLLTTACQPCELSVETAEETTVSPRLEFHVFSKASSTGTTNQSQHEEELNIRELYIYAFDDTHKRPDFFQDVFIGNGQGKLHSYKVKMSINGLGAKRFYLIANPPLYIKEKLTYNCTEGQLKTMSIALQHPLTDIQKLPQDADGVSSPGNYGFPMANQFTAVVKEGYLRNELLLTATDRPTDGAISKIPIFRSFGKVTVTINKKDAHQDGVFVKSLRIFNYTCNGFLLPQWDIQTHLNAWEPNGQWNKSLTMNLSSMSKHETIVGVDPVSLIQHDVWVESVEPTTLASFYLCQNSFGNKQLPSDQQSGLEDLIGNRTTKLAIELSDGRKSVVDFPYLRRNDHLNVRIVISKNIIQVTFLPWILNEVTPEWEDELLTHQPLRNGMPVIRKQQ